MVKSSSFFLLIVWTLVLAIFPIPVFAASNFFDAFIDGYNKMDQSFEKERQERRREEDYQRQKELIGYQDRLARQRQYEAEQSEIKRKQQEAAERERSAAEEARMREEERNNAISTGTGFFITTDCFVTNAHVVKEKRYVAIRTIEDKFYDAEVVSVDENIDLALLRVMGKFPSLRVVGLKNIEKGQKVFAIGYPQIAIQGNESKVTDGIISSFSGINDDDNWFQISVPVQGGNSGGPLIDEKGNVVGVVVASVSAIKFLKTTGNIPQNVNYAIKASVLLSFLKENKISNEYNNKDSFTISRVDKSTVLVIASNKKVLPEIGVSKNIYQENDKDKQLSQDELVEKTYKYFEKEAEQSSKSLPKMVDDGVRWDRIIAGPGAKLTFYYTITNKSSKEIDKDSFIYKVSSSTNERVCRIDGIKKAIQDNGSCIFRYYGNDDIFIGKILINKTVCGY